VAETEGFNIPSSVSREKTGRGYVEVEVEMLRKVYRQGMRRP
jgi:hypothetical protein